MYDNQRNILFKCINLIQVCTAYNFNILESGDSDISHSEITVFFDFIHYSIYQTKRRD